MQQEWSNWIRPLNFAYSENFKNSCLRDQNSNKLSCYISAINYGPKDHTSVVLTLAVGRWSSYPQQMALQWFPFPLLLAWRADYDKFNNNVWQTVGWFKCFCAGNEEETKIFFYDLLNVLSTGWSVKIKSINFKLSIIWIRYRRMWTHWAAYRLLHLTERDISWQFVLKLNIRDFGIEYEIGSQETLENNPIYTST